MTLFEVYWCNGTSPRHSVRERWINAMASMPNAPSAEVLFSINSHNFLKVENYIANCFAQNDIKEASKVIKWALKLGTSDTKIANWLQEKYSHLINT